MNLVKTIVSLVVIFGVSMLMVWVLRGWGPVDAGFQYNGEGAMLKASGLLAAVIVLSLVVLHVFGRLAKIFKVKLLAHLTSATNLFSN